MGVLVMIRGIEKWIELVVVGINVSGNFDEMGFCVSALKTFT